jgi:hypothetical protein
MTATGVYSFMHLRQWGKAVTYSNPIGDGNLYAFCFEVQVIPEGEFTLEARIPNHLNRDLSDFWCICIMNLLGEGVRFRVDRGGVTFMVDNGVFCIMNLPREGVRFRVRSDHFNRDLREQLNHDFRGIP